MNDIAETVPIGAEGIVVVPFFNGERIPNLPQGRAGILGATAANFTKANIVRAAMEAAIFGMKIGLQSFKKLNFSAQEIRHCWWRVKECALARYRCASDRATSKDSEGRRSCRIGRCIASALVF